MWRGVHLLTKTVVAVKKVQIYEIMDAKQRADCLNEVRLLQSLDHPNIIKYDRAWIEEMSFAIAPTFATAAISRD